MLMQEAEVRSSAGQHVRSHRCSNIAGSASAFEHNTGAFECSTALRSYQELVLARRRVTSVRRYANRSGIGGSTFDRKDCVRSHCRRLIFQKPKTETKTTKTKLKIDKNKQNTKIN
jgi:hypothetical protein